MTGNNQSPARGCLFVVSGPSGVGKTVLCNKMIERFTPMLVYSISATTRAPRGGETNGQEYFFYSVDEFKNALDNNLLAEWAIVHGNYYGTLKHFLEGNISQGRHVLLNIDVQGGMKILGQYPEAIMIFLQPPSFSVLEDRIRRRNTDSDEIVRKRLENARSEMAFLSRYSFSIVNDDLVKAAHELEDILRKHIQSAS